MLRELLASARRRLAYAICGEQFANLNKRMMLYEGAISQLQDRWDEVAEMCNELQENFNNLPEIPNEDSIEDAISTFLESEAGQSTLKTAIPEFDDDEIERVVDNYLSGAESNDLWEDAVEHALKSSETCQAFIKTLIQGVNL